VCRRVPFSLFLLGAPELKNEKKEDRGFKFKI
jgi:hypothetical protein